MNKFGRKNTMLGLVVPLIIGWSLLAWAQNFTMLLCGRFVLGLGGGAFYITSPQYSSEIAQKEIRGILGSFLQLLISFGVLFVYIIGSLTSVYWTNIICGICPLIFAVIFFFMPESPVYLIMKNREQEAKNALKWLRDEGYDIECEASEWKENFKEDEQKISFKEALKERSSVIALVIGFGLLYFRHMACIIPILFYATTIFAVSKILFILNFS
jgi:MFS family permease